MEIIELKPPLPWAKPRAPQACDFGIVGVLPLPSVGRKKLAPLDRVLGARRSRREFGVPVTLQQLGDLLWHSLHVRQRGYAGGRLVWETRPTPSGGGCHPVQVVVFRAPGLRSALLIYDPGHHAFGVRDRVDAGVLRRSVAEVDMCLKVGRGTVLWFVADLGRSGAKYRNPESLAWRDSGALLATVGLVAEGLGLNCCGLGLHDIPSLRCFLGLDRSVLGVGGCVVGGRAR
jgi:SagB-type dehydrogenase family enzyme